MISARVSEVLRGFISRAALSYTRGGRQIDCDYYGKSAHTNQCLERVGRDKSPSPPCCNDKIILYYDIVRQYYIICVTMPTSPRIRGRPRWHTRGPLRMGLSCGKHDNVLLCAFETGKSPPPPPTPPTRYCFTIAHNVTMMIIYHIVRTLFIGRLSAAL